MSDVQVGLSKKRFVVFPIFCAILALQMGNVMEYAMIANILMYFYEIPMNAVNVLSVSTNVMLLVMLMPASYSIKRFGIRINLLLGTFCLATGNIIKCFSVERDLYWVSVVGQYVAMMSGGFLMPIGYQIPRIWFPSHQFSTVISFVTAAQVIGPTIVIFIVTQVVPEGTIAEVASGLGSFFSGQAVLATTLFILALLFFDEKPSSVTSKNEKRVQEINESKSYWTTVKEAMNANFVLILIVASLFNAVCTGNGNLTNQIFTQYFPTKVYLLGYMNLVGSFFAFTATLVCGHLLKTRRCFRSMFAVTSLFTGLSYIAYYLSLYYEILPLVFAIKIFEVMIFAGSICIYTIGSEVNYPLPEYISSTITSVCFQISIIVFTFALSSVITAFGVIYVYSIKILVLILCVIMFKFVKINLKRYDNLSDDDERMSIFSRAHSIY